MKFIQLKTAVMASSVLVLAACGSDSSEPAVAVVVAAQDAGLLDTATPLFRWPAQASASRYRLIVEDDAGNGYSADIDPALANCDSGTCQAAPASAYHASDLSWRVEAIASDQSSTTIDGGSFSTPASLDLQPVTSNAQACEVWPSVAYDNLIVLNNTWNQRSITNGGWAQTISVGEPSPGNKVPAWSYDWLSEADGGTFDVKAYPEVIFGNKLGTHVSGPTSETGLPAKVSELPRFDVSFAYSETGNAERNVALESFFHQTCDITGPCDLIDNRTYEMMVWVGNPEIRNPSSTRAETGVEIDGRLWDVWIKPENDNAQYIAFTAQQDFATGDLHWNAFVEWTEQWTAENASLWGIDPLLPEYCMGAIEIGTELWWGQGTFSLDRYSVSVQQ